MAVAAEGLGTKVWTACQDCCVVVSKPRIEPAT